MSRRASHTPAMPLRCYTIAQRAGTSTRAEALTAASILTTSSISTPAATIYICPMANAIPGAAAQHLAT